MNFIGIDLAWTYKNETGISVINDSGKIIFSESQRYNDEMLADLVKQFSADGALPKSMRIC
jgi:predicted RNase H-like nuclease